MLLMLVENIINVGQKRENQNGAWNEEGDFLRSGRCLF